MAIVSVCFSEIQLWINTRRGKNKVAVNSVIYFDSNILSKIAYINDVTDSWIISHKKNVDRITPRLRLEYQSDVLSLKNRNGGLSTDYVVSVLFNISRWLAYVNNKIANGKIVYEMIGPILLEFASQERFIIKYLLGNNRSKLRLKSYLKLIRIMNQYKGWPNNEERKRIIPRTE